MCFWDFTNPLSSIKKYLHSKGNTYTGRGPCLFAVVFLWYPTHPTPFKKYSSSLSLFLPFSPSYLRLEGNLRRGGGWSKIRRHSETRGSPSIYFVYDLHLLRVIGPLASTCGVRSSPVRSAQRAQYSGSNSGYCTSTAMLLKEIPNCIACIRLY